MWAGCTENKVWMSSLGGFALSSSWTSKKRTRAYAGSIFCHLSPLQPSDNGAQVQNLRWYWKYVCPVNMCPRTYLPSFLRSISCLQLKVTGWGVCTREAGLEAPALAKKPNPTIVCRTCGIARIPYRIVSTMQCMGVEKPQKVRGRSAGR